MKSLPDAASANVQVSETIEPDLLQNNPMLGISLKVASVAVFVGMSTLLKAAEGIPLGQLIFFRSFFAVLAILVYFALRGQLSGILQTRHGFSHFWRGMVGVGAMSLSFYALTKLPLPEAIAINYASPLIAVVLGALILHEVVRLYRWSAVIIGLLGVMIIIWPRMTLFAEGNVGHNEAMGALAALGGGGHGCFCDDAGASPCADRAHLDNRYLFLDFRQCYCAGQCSVRLGHADRTTARNADWCGYCWWYRSNPSDRMLSACTDEHDCTI